MGGVNGPSDYIQSNEISPERQVLQKLIQGLEKELKEDQITIPAEAIQKAETLQEGEKQKEGGSEKR